MKKEENLISSDNLHLGVGTTRTVNKCITTQTLEVRKFKKNARKFSIHLVEKLKERSPVRYKYAHYRSCLSLNQIVSSKDEFSINLSKLYLLLNEQGWITTVCADRGEVSYKLFTINADVKNQMKEFNMNERLDVFYMSRLSRHVELREVVKLVMILSHGNARVESGFSANEEMLVENMSRRFTCSSKNGFRWCYE